MLKNIDRKKLLILGIGITLGALGGFLYWRFVGCSSGSCSITANWHTSTLMGGLMGYLLSDSIADKQKKRDISKEAQTE
jgi:hypothetical protein